MKKYIPIFAFSLLFLTACPDARQSEGQSKDTEVHTHEDGTQHSHDDGHTHGANGHTHGDGDHSHGDGDHEEQEEFTIDADSARPHDHDGEDHDH